MTSARRSASALPGIRAASTPPVRSITNDVTAFPYSAAENAS